MRREQAEVEGGLNLRHDGSGIWFFNGWGALSNMQFQVDAAYEMGLPLEPQLTFGPVIEQVVTGAIDFDKGRLLDLPLPPSANDREPARYDWLNSAEGKAWMRERGIDALDANRALIRVDMLLIKLKDQEWKSLTADALAAKIRSQAPATDVFNTRINTYGFQTREGRDGHAASRECQSRARREDSVQTDPRRTLPNRKRATGCRLRRRRLLSAIGHLLFRRAGLPATNAGTPLALIAGQANCARRHHAPCLPAKFSTRSSDGSTHSLGHESGPGSVPSMFTAGRRLHASQR